MRSARGPWSRCSCRFAALVVAAAWLASPAAAAEDAEPWLNSAPAEQVTQLIDMLDDSWCRSHGGTWCDAVAASDGDPTVFLDLLVERYRGMDTYQDATRAVYTDQPGGDAHADAATVEINMSVKVAGEEVTVETARSRTLDALPRSIRPGYHISPGLLRLVDQTTLARAPHLALKFASEPMQRLTGRPYDMTATDLQAVTVDDKPMVSVRLRSEPPPRDDPADETDTTPVPEQPLDTDMEILVNPESMLVERITTESHWADGRIERRELHITPDILDEDEVYPASDDPDSEPVVTGFGEMMSPVE